MENSFGIHIDCDPLSVYEREYNISVGYHELIYTQALPDLLDLLNKLNSSTLFHIPISIQILLPLLLLQYHNRNRLKTTLKRPSDPGLSLFFNMVYGCSSFFLVALWC